MRAQSIRFHETPAVEENIETFARQQFSLLVLALRALFAATGFGALI
jgi:hypothetical protein